MFHLKTHWLCALSIGWLSASSTFAAPPDLTGSGVIAGIDRTDTYNLGATGLRGWIWVDRNNKGDTGQITDQSRQILVTHCVAPANAVLAVDDVILGAIAASTGTVPDFTSDCRKAFATAIADAEKTGAGTLRVKRWRAGAITYENIPLPILGNYSATAPFSCPKSTLILDGVRNKMVADLLADPNYLNGQFGGSSSALALLSGVKSGDPNYNEVQTRLQTFARSLASAGPVNDGLPIWGWSYSLIYLSEYYLITGDSQVVPGIQSFTLKLAQSQSIYGTYGHGPAATRPDGSGRLCSTGYGPVNAAGGTAAIALVMGKKALVAAGQSVDPQIDAAIQRASGFFAFYVNKGGIPYGEHEPVITSHASNSKDATPAVFFGLQTGRATETEYFSRISIAGWIGREYGHTGQGLSYYWTTLGALMGGPDAASEHLKQIRWHLDLSRRTDGSFAYDGQEQYGPGTTAGNTYLGAADYGGMSANAMYLLTYSLPLQRLWITGKSANPAYTLNSTKIASAVAAGSFRLDRGTKSISELFTAIGDYDPIVRHYASIELASRTLSGTNLTNLRNLLSSTDPNLRQGACETLGIRQDSTALPTIVTLLNDPNIWVRAKAAIAIRAYPSATASTHRDSMMTSFIANATDPNVIDWNDPLQMGNGKLSMAIFGHGVPDGTPGNDIADYTINASKQTLLYPALRAGLKQPDSYVRAGATQFCKNRLPLADVQAVYPEAANVAEYDTPADRMWSGDCRRNAITMLAALKITEGIPLALAMLDSAPGFEWGEGNPRIGALDALASYGDAARYTLPTLKAYLNQWNPAAEEYPVLVSTIDAIENAITAPAQELGLCVANPQIVTTTGAKAITLSGASPRGAFSYINVTQPAHGTVTGTAPNLTYTPTGGYTGPDQFTFQTTDTLTTSTVATVGIVVGPSGNGANGEYFNNSNFTSPVLTRTDAQINFDWGTGSPHASIGVDTFSTRWSGVLLVPQSGNYTFSALTSDGVRLYINGSLVIDRFVDQSTKWTDSSQVYLTAGQYAEIYLEYYENTGSAVAKLKWIGPDFAGANGSFIPQAHLFDGSGISNRLVYAFPQNLTTNLNTPLPISLSGSGGTLTYSVLTPPTNGTLSGTAPYLTYTPNNNFSGNDSFTFLVNNGTKNSLPATVSINVQAGPLNSYTWASAVSGNWSDVTKWTPSLPAAAGQPTYALNFTTAGTYTATHNLNSGFQLNQLNVASNVTIDGTQSVSFVTNGGSLPQWNQSGTGTVNINQPVVLQSTTTVGSSGTIKVNGAISGSGGLIKNGPGTLEIWQTNSYSGGTTINAGTLRMEDQKDSALGTGPITLNGGTLQALRINATNSLIANGGRLWGDGGWGGSWNGPVTLNGDLTIFTYSYDRVSITGNISGAGGLIAEGDTSTYNSGNGVFLSGTNTYTGKTTVKAGMLLHCSSPAALGSGAVEISGGAKLDLNFTGNKTVDSLTLDGALMPPGTYGSSTSNATNKNDTYFSGNGTLTVLQPTTTSLNLTTGSSPANPGTSLTFTATVTGSSPTGNVQFYSGTTLLGTSVLNGSSQATFTTSQLAIGSNSITARYVGDASNSPSTSSPVVVEINNTTPAAATNLTATPAGTQINLAWTASPGATGYYVKRSTTNGGPYAITAFVSATTYEDPNVLLNVTYYYVISAVNSAGESTNSNQAEAWTAEYTVTYNANGGSTPAPLSKQVLLGAPYGALADTSRAGHAFNGWFTAASGGTQVTSGSIVATTADHTLYAQWTVSTYTVTYDGNGNTGGVAPTNQTKTYDVALTLATAGTLVRTGYSFAGWNSAADGSGAAYGAGTNYTANAAVTLYAQWTANNYTVTFDANGGTAADPASKQVTFGATYGTLATTSRAGYVLTGWFTQASGGTKVETSTTVTATDNHTLFAQWTNSFTWDANGTTAGQTNGAGAWLGDNLWWNGVANQNWVSGINATIGGVASNGGNLTLASPTTVSSITFNSFTSTYTLGTAGQALTINSGITKNAGSDAVTFVSPITLGAAQTWTNNSTGLLKTGNGTLLTNGGFQLTIDGTGDTEIGQLNAATATLSGSGALVKNGTGTLSIGGDNSAGFSGDVTINGGVLNYGDVPTSLGTGNLKITNGILTSRWSTGKTWAQGTTAGTIQITGGESGFASGNGATFNIGAVTWGSSTFNPTKFAFNHATSASGASVKFSSSINLNGVTRTIVVNGGVAGTARAELSGVISNSTGTAGLTKEGTGFLLLTTNAATSSWNGNTTVSAGILHLGAANLANIGGGSGRNISVATGAGVGFNVLSNAILNRIVETTAEISLMTGTTSNAFDFSSSTGATLTNAFLGSYLTNGGKVELSGIITAGGGAYRLGAPGGLQGGTLGIRQESLLSGTNQLIIGGNRVVIVGAHTFTGDTTLRDGALLGLSGLDTDAGAAKNNSLALQNSVLDLGVPSSTGLIFLEAGNAGGITGFTTSVNGGTQSATFGGMKGSRNLYSAFKFTSPGNNTSAQAATAITGFTLNVGTVNTATYSGAIGGFGAGATGSTGGSSTLTKTGLGTQILGGANTYTGGTTVSAGKLLINGSLSNVNAALTVASDATLGGNGTVGRNVTVDAGGKLEFDISTAAAGHDALDVSTGRDFAFSGASTLTITSSSGASPGIYTLITGGNNIIGSAPATLVLPSGWAATVSISGNSLLLNITSTASTYAVTYNSNGATSGTVPSTQTKTYDVNLNLATNSGTLARTGYTFTGWNTAVNGSGTSYAVGANYAANAAVTLYATWTMLPYTSWSSGTFANAFTDTAYTSNPDGDSLTNLQEFAFGTDPTSSVNAPLSYLSEGAATPGIPILENTGTAESPNYRAVFARRKNHATDGISYEVQFSANLQYWKASSNGMTVLSGTSTADVEAVSIPFPTTVPLSVAETEFAAPKFFRVAVIEN